MLTFIRKIRKSLIESGSVRKYALYAFGEITLVVIGILIALQINNWNQMKSAEDFQLKMLMEIRSGLQQDREYIGAHIPWRVSFLEEALEYFDTLLLSGDKGNRDSTNHFIGTMYNTYHITLNRGPYDALKFTGIDKVVNDSLRNHLIFVYDFIYPRYEEFLLFSENQAYDEVKMLIDKLTKKRSVHIEDGNVHYGWGIKTIDFRTNQDFLKLLDRVKWRIERTTQNAANFVPYIDSLIEQLDEEIGHYTD